MKLIRFMMFMILYNKGRKSKMEKKNRVLDPNGTFWLHYSRMGILQLHLRLQEGLKYD